jgi:ubiquinone/menaquinone biosynthesis C-methylase UbiE
MADPTQRFSNRVENYVRYRPRYPRQIIENLRTECGLNPGSVIADVGSGTGMFSELFLANGNRVYGIEPNREMREAAERLLKAQAGFVSVAGSAEATTLPDSGVYFVTAGQAFHWFERARCRIEFARILRPGGWVVLAWNDRRTESTPFLRAYEQLLLEYATDYKEVNHKRMDDSVLGEFFQTAPARRSFPSYQQFDFESLKGRLLSSSYAPEAGQPRHPEMLNALEKVFAEHQRGGQVTFEYDTLVYFARLNA